MDFALEPEQEEFRKTVRAFAEEVVAPRAEAMDRAEEMDPAVLDQMAGMGLFGLPFPERSGASPTSSRSSAGCRRWHPARGSAPSASPSRAAAPTPARCARAPAWRAASG